MKKEEGRRKKEDGRRKKEDGRRKTEKTAICGPVTCVSCYGELGIGN